MAFAATIVFPMILLLVTLILTTQAQQSIVDGTKCQFSDRAKGRNLTICSTGFAGGIASSNKGQLFTVSDPSDNPYIPQPGTLRYYVLLASRSPRGGWIVFKSDMAIDLLSDLWIGSYTAVDGRGFNVKITGYPIIMGGANNVILENLQFDNSESHAVRLFLGSSKIWLDHLSIRGSKMGFQLANGSTDVTISNCHLTGIEESMILGARDSDSEDRKMRVTVYRNFFEQGVHNMPHCRFGYCHIANNHYRDWVKYTLGGRVNARVYSEMNVFEPIKALQVTSWFKGLKNDTSAIMESHNDALLNGARFTWFKHQSLVKPPYTVVASYPPLEPTATLPRLLKNCAGALYGPRLRACARAL